MLDIVHISERSKGVGCQGPTRELIKVDPSKIERFAPRSPACDVEIHGHHSDSRHNADELKPNDGGGVRSALSRGTLRRVTVISTLIRLISSVWKVHVHCRKEKGSSPQSSQLTDGNSSTQSVGTGITVLSVKNRTARHARARVRSLDATGSEMTPTFLVGDRCRSNPVERDDEVLVEQEGVESAQRK
jgi:hypothetical protein